MVPTGSVLGERYRRLASRQDNLGAAVAAATALVDRSASIAVHMIRQYPWVRLAALLYLLFLHLYCYVITSSMQSLAASATTAAVAAAAAVGQGGGGVGGNGSGSSSSSSLGHGKHH